jgi:hypothetical protein
MMYNRELLLAGAKRDAILELWEVQRYGADSYGDADYVCLYGMQPGQWYARGVRLLGRTAVECTRDDLARAIAMDVAWFAAGAPDCRETLVVDPFAGSGNTLHWLLQHLPGARGLGFELDAGVFELTRRNVAALALDIRVLNTDYACGLAQVRVADDQLLVVFIAPPWADALSAESGLDLRRTKPPVADIVDFVLQTFPRGRILFAVQVYETLEPGSLTDLRSRFDGSALRIYGLNAAGQNHGVLLGTKRWSHG